MENKTKFQGKGNILLVETDAEVRERVSSVLVSAGYRVFEAGDGNEAFLISETINEQMHLLLTDAALDGGLNGVDLARHLLVLNRQLKVLYLSLYPDDISIRRQLQSAFPTYLAKPVESDRLLEKVAAMMEKIRIEAGSGAAAWKQEADLERQAKLTRMFPQGFTGRLFPHGKGGHPGCRPVGEPVV
jgi:CheY-like chemotaxis protein